MIFSYKNEFDKNSQKYNHTSSAFVTWLLCESSHGESSNKDGKYQELQKGEI